MRLLSRQLRAARFVLGRELRELFMSRSLWALLVFVGPLVGFSFLQAVYLYAEVSRSAEKVPALARSLSPLDGIVIPTFGALYLANTFLLPFVAIRLIGNDKQSGGLKLLLQLPVDPARLVAIKLAAIITGWTLALGVSLSALAIWVGLGGHLHGPEVSSVLLGHAFYALLIISIAFFASALTESAATAAIVALAFTLGGWVLDFAGGSQLGVVRTVAAFSPTTSLRTFERGLVGLPQTLSLVVPAVALLGLTAVWLPSGTARIRKVGATALVVGLTAALLLVAQKAPIYADLSEDRRNSFQPVDEQSLRGLEQELRVTVRLAPADSRLRDFDRNVLNKLRRVVPHVLVEYAETGATPLFGGAADDRYGLTTFEYGGQRAETRATTAREVLPLIYRLAGLQVTPQPPVAYPGYPLAADARAAAVWFYAGVPLGCLGGWWLSRRPPRRALEAARGSSRRRVSGRARIRRQAAASLVVVAGFVVLQLVPYGRDHPNPAVQAESAARDDCQATPAPGVTPAATLGELQSVVRQMTWSADQALAGLPERSLGVILFQVHQITTTYERARTGLAMLYPRRCAAPDRARQQAENALVLRRPPDLGIAGPSLTAMRASLIEIDGDLEGRIARAGKAGLLVNQPAETVAPLVTGAPPWDSQDTRMQAERACAACHSNQPGLPWYSRVAPLSWVVERDVQAGRRVLNLSEWDRVQMAGSMVADAVEKRRMPPPSRIGVYPGTDLSTAERDALARGLLNTFGGRTGLIINMTDYAFQPNQLRIEGGEGQHIVITLENKGTAPHSFSAPTLKLQSREMAPGDSQTVDFISLREEPVRFVCGMPGHEQAGMVGYLTFH